MNNLLNVCGEGFIGFYFINKLIDKRLRLVFLDGFSNGNYANIKKWFINNLFEIKKNYITNPFNINQAINYVLNIWILSYGKI